MENTRDFYAKLRRLVLPIAFQQFMIAAVSASDAIMLGFLNQDSLSAVSLAGQVQFVYTLFLFALTAGTSIFTAQYWGKGDRKSVEKVLGISLKASVFISLLFTLAAIFLPELLMKAFTPEKRLIELGAEYLRIVGISYFMLGISQIYLCIMKNCGQAMKSAVISAVSMAVNIGLNALLIFGIGIFPSMGVAGAAVATTVSKAVELVWTLAEMLRKDRIKIRLSLIIHNDRTLLKDFWKYTLPVLGNQIGWGGGFTMYTVIMGHLNDNAVAANSIANIVKNLAVCVCTGIASGGGIIVGNELGRGNLDRAKEYGARVCRIAVIGGIISGAVLLVLSPLVVRVANLTPEAKGYLKVMLIVCSYYIAGKSVNMTTISGIFCAGGDSRFGLVCDTVTMWAVTVPLGLISAFVLKLPVLAVYIIINIDEIIKLPAVYRHYKKYLWVKDLTREM